MKILFTWEWGAGSGHLTRFVPLGEHLVQAGHQVTVVARDVHKLAKLFPASRYNWLQAPDIGRCSMPKQNPVCAADLAYNLGFDDLGKVAVALGIWRHVFEVTQPDWVISDFGMGSLFVASAMGIPTARIGTGYTCPPEDDSCPPLASSQSVSSDIQLQSLRSSGELLDMIHKALVAIGLSSKVQWRDVWLEPNRTLLATLPPLDPYHHVRSGADYLGVWQPDSGIKPEWNGNSRGRVIAYLKPFRWIGDLLRCLALNGFETLLYGDGIPESLLAPVQGPMLKISQRPISFTGLNGGCSFAICNGNHGTTSQLLSEGIPLLAVPLYLEQRITAETIERMKWGVNVDPQQPASFPAAIAAIMEPSLLDNTLRYADQYQYYCNGALERAINQLDMILGSC